MKRLAAMAVCAALSCTMSFTPAQSQEQGQEQEQKRAQPKIIKSCYDDPAYHQLDFWIGEWNVVLGQRVVGTNRIERVLKGCAIVEHWEAKDGGIGMSLFYYNRTTDTWRQVWVTDGSYSPGGLKEKELVEHMRGGGVRFQGEIALPGGGTYLDRTTLTPQNDGSVRQVIQVSHDDGENWTTTFDATYVRTGRASRGGGR